MKAEKLVTVKEPVEIEVTGVTLLSREEYKAHRHLIPPIAGWWWLRLSGDDKYNAEIVSRDGFLYYGCVDSDSGFVRPALIVNLESANLKSGDRILIAGYEWTVLNDQLAICNTSVGETCFRDDYFAEDANDYEKSDIKKWIASWARARGLIQ